MSEIGVGKFLLDTNAVIALMKGNPPFISRMKKYLPSSIKISSITSHELFFGAYKSQRREENLAHIARVNLEVLTFDEQDAQSAGEVRAFLRAAGTPIGPLDSLIAGVALARNLILITNNTREFLRVPGLKVRNWQVHDRGPHV
jgi:tRNA(fMet)-specific endonuclease VapC